MRAVLKRPQEAELVVQILKNARLVEDAVREMLAEAARLPLPDESVMTASVRAQESVHAFMTYTLRVHTALGRSGSHSVPSGNLPTVSEPIMAQCSRGSSIESFP